MEQNDNAGVYCGTSGTYFKSKEELTEHYKSDFHRYNLKRKIAGLPPVTREWFEQRKEQLSCNTALACSQKVLIDPLTKKRFNSENTYATFTRSKKYQDLVNKSGRPAPHPIITLRRFDDVEEPDQRDDIDGAQPSGFTMKVPNRGPSADKNEVEEPGSDWETESEKDETNAGSPSETVAWDVKRSLFDNQMSDSCDANLEYMWKKFGFYLPDAEFLDNPEGLLKYLGAKLSEGHIPLYVSGLDPEAKRLASLHAVQRHMIDTNQCKMLYNGVEEEYEDFYDYSKALSLGTIEEGSKDLVMGDSEGVAKSTAGGYELELPGKDGKPGKILGNREFLRYYRQKHRQLDGRSSNNRRAALQQRYRNLGVALIEGPGQKQSYLALKQARKAERKGERLHLNTQLQANINRDLPRNVPY